MDDETLKLKVDYFSNQLDNIIMKCESIDELTILATIMMAYARKGLGITIGNQDLADACMFDYLDALAPTTPKAIV